MRTIEIEDGDAVLIMGHNPKKVTVNLPDPRPEGEMPPPNVVCAVILFTLLDERDPELKSILTKRILRAVTEGIPIQ